MSLAHHPHKTPAHLVGGVAHFLQLHPIHLSGGEAHPREDEIRHESQSPLQNFLPKAKIEPTRPLLSRSFPRAFHPLMLPQLFSIHPFSSSIYGHLVCSIPIRTVEDQPTFISADKVKVGVLLIYIVDLS